ncbi:MAG TPA: hypothetical protein DD666_00710 [Advenella kashmirensis]|uniref:Uncharacterized protein n=1 Tax=Advenella kashmirensis TaxID=310575 RepID=A0A356LA80_9BURK|nr:hypothetical protein [Advenella kashmirensis]
MTVDRRKAFAESCATSYAHLNNFAHGQKPRIGESLCINIERESNGVIVCEDLRADVDWAVLRNTRKPEVLHC